MPTVFNVQQDPPVLNVLQPTMYLVVDVHNVQFLIALLVLHKVLIHVKCVKMDISYLVLIQVQQQLHIV